MKTVFRIGDLGGIAASVGVSRSYIVQILSGKRYANAVMAQRLVRAALLEGLVTTQLDWMWPEMSGHPAFIDYLSRRRNRCRDLDFSK